MPLRRAATLCPLLLPLVCAPACGDDDDAVAGAGGMAGHGGAGASDAGGMNGDGGSAGAPSQVMVEMRDGVALHTRVFLPLTDAKVPTVLWRSPYREVLEFDDDAEFYAAVFNAEGYAFVFQDVRGRAGSEGDWEPLVHEIDDGRDTTDWIAEQPWSDGAIASIGGSYDGFTALATAVDNPRVAAVLADDPAVDALGARMGGPVSTRELTWLYLVDTGAALDDQAIFDAVNALDPLTLDETVLGRQDAYWRSVVQQTQLVPFPADGSVVSRGQDLCAPTYLVHSQSTLWPDPAQAQRALVTGGCATELHFVMTPEPHVYHLGMLGTEQTDVNQQMLEFLAHHLKGAPDPQIPPVQARMGARGALVSLDAWPPRATPLSYYLNDDSFLLVENPAGGSALTLSVDPATDDPCSVEYPFVEMVSEPMTEPTRVAGALSLEATVDADVPDFDLHVWAYALDPQDAYVELGWGTLQARYRGGDMPDPLDPGEPAQMRVELTPAAAELEPGDRLLIYVALGSCQTVENPQTGEPPDAQTSQQAGTVTLRAGSRLVVPRVGGP